MDFSKIITMLKNPITLVGVIVAVYFFFFKKDKKTKTRRVTRYKKRYSNYRPKRRYTKRRR